jgi:hypothetical protein
LTRTWFFPEFSVPIGLFILLLIAAVLVVLAWLVTTLCGIARRDGRLPVLLGELNLPVATIAAVARLRPISLAIRSPRAPPTFPKQPDDARFGDMR